MKRKSPDRSTVDRKTNQKFVGLKITEGPFRFEKKFGCEVKLVWLRPIHSEGEPRLVAVKVMTPRGVVRYD